MNFQPFSIPNRKKPDVHRNIANCRQTFSERPREVSQDVERGRGRDGYKNDPEREIKCVFNF